MKLSQKAWLTLAIMSTGFLSIHAQLKLTESSPTIKEDFNSMQVTEFSNDKTKPVNVNLPEGWKLEFNGVGPRQVGDWAKASSVAMYTLSEKLASNASNGTYCWSASDENSDHALGGLTTTVDGGARGINVLTQLLNNEQSKIITNLSLSYNIEQYRLGNNPSGFSVRVFTSKDGVKWTEQESLIQSFDPDDTTDGVATVPIKTVPVTKVPLRVHLEPNDPLYLAWNISVTSGTTCNNAPGYAIDDVEITATFADEDPDWVEEETPEITPSGIYLRGEVNGWGGQIPIGNSANFPILNMLSTTKLSPDNSKLGIPPKTGLPII